MISLASGHTGLAIGVLTFILWLLSGSLLVALLAGLPLGWLWLRTFLQGTSCQSTKRLDGRVVVVTGASAGIGLYTAKDLAARGARVILAVRNMDKGEEAAKWIKERTGGLAKVECQHLDLASFKSVREFSRGLAAREAKLDILVNNAGIAFSERTITEDGNEMLFQTNHLGNFLLTNLLLDLLKAAGKSRVVSVSSMAHAYTQGIQFDDLKWEKKAWKSMEAYNQSKLANIYFMQELAVKTKGTGISTYSVHPGVVDTEIGKNLRNKIPAFLLPITDKFKLFLKTPEAGAQTTIYCCVEESIQNHSGRYYADCKEKEVSKVAVNGKASSQLWTVSVGLVGDITAVSPGGSFSFTRESISVVEGKEGMGGSIARDVMAMVEGKGGVVMSQSQTITKVVKRSVVTSVTNSSGGVDIKKEESNQHQKLESIFTKDGNVEDKKSDVVITKDDSSEDEKKVIEIKKEEPIEIKDDSSSSEDEKEEVSIKKEETIAVKDDSSSSEDENKETIVTKLSDFLRKDERNEDSKEDSSSSEDEREDIVVTKLSDYLAKKESHDSSDDEKEVVMVTKDDNNGGLKEEAIIIREDNQSYPKHDSSSSSSEDEEKVSVL